MTSEMDSLVTDFSRFYILTILSEGPAHGYNILSKFRRRTGKKISPSLIYPFLSRLEENGFLSHTIKPIGEKERKVYQLTEKGSELCTRLFKRFADLVSVAIEPNLQICANCGCKVYEGGHKETIDGKTLVFCCVHCAQYYSHGS